MRYKVRVKYPDPTSARHFEFKTFEVNAGSVISAVITAEGEIPGARAIWVWVILDDDERLERATG